jgi:hypothetical protein
VLGLFSQIRYPSAMPSKPRDPTKRTVYLDQSTLSDLIQGVTVGRTQKPGMDTYKALLPWVQHIAKTENFCLSIAHVIELAPWQDQGAVRAAVELLDELPTVWVEIGQSLADAEEEYWLSVAAGADQAGRPPYFPSVPSMLSALHPTSPGQLAGMLQKPTLMGLVNGAMGRGTTQEQEFSRQAREKIRMDRDWAQRVSMNDTEKKERLDYNERVDLRQRGMEAHQRLRNKPDLAYAATGVTQGGASELLERIYSENRVSLPSFRVCTKFFRGYADMVRRRSPGSKGDQALDSSIMDATHLSVGAAYCDIFTCDSMVSQALGDVRERLGFARQMSVSELGGPEGFVRALTAL